MKATVEEGELRITVDIDTLAHAIENGPVRDTYGARVTNREQLANWVAEKLTSDDNEDVSPLARVIEDQVARGIEDGECDELGLEIEDEEDEL